MHAGNMKALFSLWSSETTQIRNINNTDQNYTKKKIPTLEASSRVLEYNALPTYPYLVASI